jgi:tight adherence protein C
MIAPLLGALASAALAAAAGTAAWIVTPSRLPASCPGGERGERRRDALARWPAFGFALPLLHALAAQIGALARGGTLRRIERRLELAGHPLGFDAAELLASAAALSALFAAGGALISRACFGILAPGAIVGAVCGAAVPFVKVDDAIRARSRAIGRGLPQAIDLIALAMEGGGDLLSAMGHVVARLAPMDPLRFELRHVVRKLALGHSRAAAFSQLAERVPSPVVKQFVASVLQGEKQGTPLGEVLAVQASVMRLRRSEAAEQAAARAAVLIIGPLMLIFACVFVVLLGPFAIQAARGELF